MPTFYLLDHSLKGAGGHHFDYACLILRAAEAAGFGIVLAAHTRFREHFRLPVSWDVVTPYRHSTYCRFALYQSSRSRRPAGPRQHFWSGSVGRWWDRRARQRRIEAFAGGCRQVFERFPVESGDQVFLPTISEFDLQGLAAYLARDANSLRADWHLQFHYNIFQGREPEYAAQQERLEAMRAEFLQSLLPLPRHRLHFYTTCRPLADQYNRLGVAEFESLAYPIRIPLSAKPDRTDSRPLRITCPGGLRQEKGQQQLAELVARLWPDGLADGRLQLVVQSNKRWFRLPVPDQPPPSVDGPPPVEYAPHPLPPAEYERLLKRADIGLLLYDSRRYFARRAGVLGELLAGGVPVVVPAGCWLSEQLAEPVFIHRQRLPDRYPVLGRHDVGDLRIGPGPCRTAFPASLSDADPFEAPAEVPPRGAATVTVPVPEGSTDVLVSWQWPKAVAAGHFTCLALRWWQPPGTSPTAGWCDSSSGAASPQPGAPREIVGGRDGGPVSVLLPCPPGASQVTLQWHNAYSDGPLQLEACRLTFLDASTAAGGHAPNGAVGVIAAGVDQVPRLLNELCAHYSHYQQTAADFSTTWSEQHAAPRTLTRLLERARLLDGSRVLERARLREQARRECPRLRARPAA